MNETLQYHIPTGALPSTLQDKEAGKLKLSRPVTGANSHCDWAEIPAQVYWITEPGLLPPCHTVSWQTTLLFSNSEFQNVLHSENSKNCSYIKHLP